MKATLPEKFVSNGKNLDRDKERVNTIKVVGIVNGKLIEVCEARFWMARRSDGASPVYCSIWVHPGHGTAGHGKASGYGYHKESAALQDAIDSAGIKLTGDNYSRKPEDADVITSARIDGCGQRALEEALQAIAIAAGADAASLLIV